ncbi:MAG: SDR family NAD(P)-dependent oxidoreductase, partial [Flavobacteriaceae bacterium]
MKKAIIVGATSGMGKELCQILLKNNYHLGIAAPEADLLEAIKATDPHNIHTACFDSIKEENTPHLNKLVTALGGLDLLVFCAGIGNFNGSDGHKKENHANKLNVLAFTEIAYWA